MEALEKSSKVYAPSLVKYQRRITIPVTIGDVPLGSDYPIRVQSMTTVDTMDTEGSIAQSIRMIEAGCEYVRITAPSIKEAQNLENIRKGLRLKGYQTPLIADIHFTPNAAELAARLVEKVRVNPGNYADKKKFQTIEYTDETYQAELDRIRERFTPLVKICKEYGTAMRIGTNHGSLSDRILSRYGDTPLGMVESALEFLRICEDENYYNIVISMKASNTQVMVQAYRLLVQKLNEQGLKPYPLHLGVTEAGEAEDGRIKSAVGIGTLLEDGLGDTVRVSLTEEPEYEAPVAKALIDRYATRANHQPIKEINNVPIDPYAYHRRESIEVENFGSKNVPRVIADLSHLDNSEMKDLKAVGHHYLPALDKWSLSDYGADYLYVGKNRMPFMLANGTREILDFDQWQELSDKDKELTYPYFKDPSHITENKHKTLNFVGLNADLITKNENRWHDELTIIAKNDSIVVILYTENEHAYPALRRSYFDLLEKKIPNPVVVKRAYATTISDDKFQLYSATDIGGLLIDGFGDGVMMQVSKDNEESKGAFLERVKMYNATAFGILQAGRTRMSKTEYISCPSCGRTLFDLQETTAMIRKRTDHLKGVKIGIMGCIVNGPGEMADADYGYVGVGKGKIALYRGQDVVKKAVPSEKAVDELIELIREDGNWNEPEILAV